MEPVTTLTAAAIADLAFRKFIESGAGELAKKFTEGAIVKMDALRQKIWNKLRGKPTAELAITSVEQGSKAELDRLIAYLQVEMDNDPQFKEEVQTLAQQIHQEIAIGEIIGRNVQQVFEGQGLQVNDPQAPVIQAQNSPITFNYGVPPQP